MRADRTHAVVDAIATAPGLAFNMVEREGMHHRPRRPPRRGWHRRNDLRGFGRIRTKTASPFRTRAAGLISRHNPGASDGIFAEFHVVDKHCERMRVNWDF